MTLAAEPEVTTNGHTPLLAQDVELIGEYEGSGFKEPPSLVRRPDGQVIQLPTLLYLVASKSDGSRSVADIADEVSREIRRGVDAQQVQFLVDEKLRPLGVLATADGTSPEVEKPDPFLGLKLRVGVISERVSGALGTMFRPLFFGPIVLAALAALVVTDYWLFFQHGVAQSIRQSIAHPGLFLPLFAVVVLAAGFHEIGHAAACRAGGGHPGKMGCGLYLAWPAFYTDVTDAYRLGRRDRLRTDLGGVYFNVVLVLATMGLYLATHLEPLLLVIVIQHFEIVHQLLPVVRLDGYYIVADLTGVPDLFARIGPILSSMVPFRRADERVTVLKRWVRVAVTAWVLVVVPLLLLELFVVLIHLPRMLATAWESGRHLWTSAGHAFARGDVLSGISSVLQLIVLAIPMVGILLMLWTAGRGAAVSLWRRTEGKPVARSLALATFAAAAVLLGLAWIPSSHYDPIRPGERGTVAQGISAVRHLPTAGPTVSERDARRRAAPATANDPVATSPSTTTTSTTDESTTTTSSTATTVEPAPAAGTTRTTAPRSSTSTTSSTTSTTSPTTTSPP